MTITRKMRQLVQIIERKVGILMLFYLVSFMLVFAMFWGYHQQDSMKINNLIQAPSKTLPRNLWNDFNVEHHTDLQTHRLQMEIYSESSPELHQIMAKQYDVPYGLYEGKPYNKILYWNKADTLPLGRENSNFGLGVGSDRFKSAGCPVWQCETSEDRSNLLEYDVILFNQRTFNVLDLPKQRSPHQRYIFFSFESAAYPNPTQKENLTYVAMIDFFNWTMTYRWDSDVVHPYGWIEPIKSSVPLHPSPEEYDRLLNEKSDVNYAAGKTKMAAFFATNCLSRAEREEAVYELMDYSIQVDWYGGCGNMTCGSFYFNQTGDVEKSKEESCLEMVGNKYKFFLSFHNSLCIDYIAERFYDAIRFPIIPVVLDAHGHHAKVAPPHSFINALDFPSIRHLADYLDKLDKNDTLYNEYFWWKKHYKIRNGVLYSGLHYRTYCSLCAVLHDHSPRPNYQVYNDMKSWWIDKSQCKTMKYDGIYASSTKKITNN